MVKRAFVCWVLLALVTGCSSTRQAGTRPFRFGEDTFAFVNNVKWEYGYDAKGHWHGHPREPEPEYTQHCFVVSRSARQFFQHAHFDASLPEATEEEYRKLVRKVISTSPRTDLPEPRKIVIPGYANLWEFSRKYEPLLKEECGSWWHSYFQRGHWRMVFPFSHGHQEKMAAQLALAVRENRPPIVHLACFPSLRINHAVVLYEVEETPEELRFTVYDPNSAAKPERLIFDRKERVFNFSTTTYFPGGNVSVYEVYTKGCY